MADRSTMTRLETIVGLLFVVLLVSAVGFGATKWSDSRIQSALVDMVHADEAEAKADSIRGALESLLSADSVRHAQALDTIAAWQTRASEANARGRIAVREGARVAESLRMTLDSVQAIQLDSIQAASTEAIASAEEERDLARSEALLWRTRFDDVSGNLALSRSESAELREANARLRSAGEAERSLRRSAERRATVWKGIALTETAGVLVVAAIAAAKVATD